ncbi:uncharacterized protein isoform X2 [Choristoneura fumiferana]|uniref:uncharacterized protein isoform X2 n=1 Tax=Choristoneura fumiferana TaxID=7141 RepID=UPI003D15EDFE
MGKSSSELMCCRGCLATDCNLFDIYKNQLAEAYECITGYPMLPHDGFPQQLCAMCGVQLAKSAAFRDRCRRAQDCLRRQHHDKITMDYIETIDRLSHNLVFTLAPSQVEVNDTSIYSLGVSDIPSIAVKETIFEDEFELFGLDTDEHSRKPIDNDQKLVDDIHSHSPIDDDQKLVDDIHSHPPRDDDQKLVYGIHSHSPIDDDQKLVDDIHSHPLIDDDQKLVDGIHSHSLIDDDQKLVDVIHSHSPIDDDQKLVDDIHSHSPIEDDQKLVDDNDKSDEVQEIGKKIKIVQVLIPTDKVEVQKRPRRKRNKQLINKNKKLKKRRIRGSSPTNKYQPNFDVAELEKELNVDVEILTKEQQLADWRQFSASKKRPAAFSCQECGKGFDQPTSYQNHLLRHGPSAGRFPCEVCGVRFQRRSTLRCHELRHALRFICRECKFVTRIKNQAKQHFSSHEGHKFQCKHCEKSFVKRSSYLSHVRLVHVAESVTCVECGETFVSRLGLKLHNTKMHQAQKAASKCACASCGAPFDDAEALQAHARAGCDPADRPCATCGASLPTDEALRTHTEECHKGEFKCTECPLSFLGEGPRDKHYWRVHCEVRSALGHTGRQGWASRVCPQCGKQFQKSFLLEQHMRSHSGEKPFACPDCALRFNYPGNLKRHQKVHQGQRPMVKCGECGKRLGAASLATHVKYVHRKLPQKPRHRKRPATST